ncbi:hypothetical protein ACA910_005576 [Epithemia clementina (nom. ined.)]
MNANNNNHANKEQEQDNGLPTSKRPKIANENNNNNHNKMPQQQEETNDFIASMTFAFLGRQLRQGQLQQNEQQEVAGCECCDEGQQGQLPLSSSLFIPDPILRAIQEHHRRKARRPNQNNNNNNNGANWLFQMPMTPRTQERHLVKRHHHHQQQQQVSVWQWTLPCHAEPLCEYGNTSHRLIWVRQLPPKRVVQAIGTAGWIIGSLAEEQSRETMDWKAGHVYFVPATDPHQAHANRNGSSGAVGWVNSSRRSSSHRTTNSLAANVFADWDDDNVPSRHDDDDRGDDEDNDESSIVLTIAKVPHDALQSFNKTKNGIHITTTNDDSKINDNDDQPQQQQQQRQGDDKDDDWALTIVQCVSLFWSNLQQQQQEQQQNQPAQNNHVQGGGIMTTTITATSKDQNNDNDKNGNTIDNQPAEVPEGPQRTPLFGGVTKTTPPQRQSILVQDQALQLKIKHAMTNGHTADDDDD